VIADEQERVQKKTFVNWINSYLSKVNIIIAVKEFTLHLYVCAAVWRISVCDLKFVLLPFKCNFSINFAENSTFEGGGFD
jgi:hypothetical protein